MMVIFFIGIGFASMLTALAETPLQIGAGLFAIGCFAAIYHPVGLAMVVHGRVKTGVPLAVNGIFGNMGVASAALIAGLMIDQTGWRTAFVLPGAISISTGLLGLRPQRRRPPRGARRRRPGIRPPARLHRSAPPRPRVRHHLHLDRHRRAGVSEHHLLAAQDLRRAPRRHRGLGDADRLVHVPGLRRRRLRPARRGLSGRSPLDPRSRSSRRSRLPSSSSCST